MLIKHNFYAGPGALPRPVVDAAEQGLRSYNGTGISIMEYSHRSAPVVDLIDDTLDRFRRLLKLDGGWEVMLLQGGGSLQFVMVPYNLSRPGEFIDYVDTGYWTCRAIDEAGRCQRALRVVASSAPADYRQLPNLDCGVVDGTARYLHLCSNNTVVGTQWHQLPETATPLVIDASSDLLARKLNLDNVNLLYAHAQKNAGLAGVTLVAVRKCAILENESLPKILSYGPHIEKRSNFHTPPVFAIYITNLMLKWLEHEIGGITVISAINRDKSRRLYDAIDSSSLFDCPIVERDRSHMNVVFSAGSETQDARFVEACTADGIVGVAGHRSRKRLRVSLYNAVTLDDVDALVAAMERFEKDRNSGFGAFRGRAVSDSFQQ
jgi:phosphoserine aminotransferase